MMSSVKKKREEAENGRRTYPILRGRETVDRFQSRVEYTSNKGRSPAVSVIKEER